MENITVLLDNLTTVMAWFGLYAFIFLLAKWAKDLFTPYSLNDELAERDNLAISLTMSGYYLAITLIFLALLSGAVKELKSDLLNVASYAALGVIVLNVSRWINDKFILRTFCNIEMLTKEQDNGVGAIQFAVYLATGLIASGAVSGEGSFITFIVFFALGQVCLIAFSLIYSRIAPFDLYRELENKNLSAAIAFAGTLIAFGLIVKNGVSGDFINWKDDLISFSITAISGFVCIPILLKLSDRLVIPGKRLSKEIAEDKSLAAGVLEATIAICFALVLIKLL